MVAVLSAERAHPAQALLPLKFSVPPARAGTLLRQDLQDLLADVRMAPLTLVVAPAGYGKTTLLSRWTQDLVRTGTPVCWLSLDNGDRDPAMFLAYLIGALQTAFPTIGIDAWRVLQSAAQLDRDWPLVAGALCSDLQRHLQTTTFLVLDDIHSLLDSAVIVHILGYLLRAAPPALHIVLSSRRAPAFAPLGRMRAEGRVVEIGQQHLHLTTREVEHILAAQGVTFSQEAMEQLLERTDGWALSVQLAARALANQPPARREDFVRALGGSQEQLLNYLSSEVLADLPVDIIDFLRLAAIPTWFDAELLAEVLQSEDVTYLLHRTRALGLPILPLDEQGVRLRFHPLWRELLLRSTAGDPDNLGLRVLQRRFGEVFEARGDLEAAMEHYAAARDTADLVRALRERAWPLLRTPRRDMVRRWLEQIPASVRENEPDLLHIFGMSLVSADANAAQQRLGRAVELYGRSGQFEREMRALSDLSALLFWQGRSGDFEWIVRRVAYLARQLGDDWSIGATRVCVTALLFTRGRESAALRVARQAASYPLNSVWRWILSMLVAAISVRIGYPPDALAAVDEALSHPEIDLDDRFRQNLRRHQALALFEQGNMVDSLPMALDAHRHLGEYGQNGMTALSAAQLALMMVLQGRLDEANTYIIQARSTFGSIGDTRALANLQVLEIHSELLRGQLQNEVVLGSTLRRLQDTSGRMPDLRMWLLLAVTFGESGHTQRALNLAREVAAHMERRGYRLFLAVTHLYIAHLAGRSAETALQHEALVAGWALVAADDHRYLPMLPSAAVRDVLRAGLLAGIDRQPIGQVLRRQIPESAAGLLQDLLQQPQPAIRANAARMLGELGATGAYAALRGLLKDRDTSVRQAAEDALNLMVYRPSYTLRIRTLGAFTIWRGDQEVKDRDWRSSKARQLFQILLTERGKTLPRDYLLEVLWPEMAEEAAFNNLRVTLNRMSKAIEPDRPEGAPSSYVVQQAETYSFNVASDYAVDASAFLTAVEQGREALNQGQRQPAVEAFRRAIGLYGGVYLPDSMYEDWAVIERERLMLLFHETAVALGMLLLDEGLAHEAIGLAWRVLEYDQAQEESYRLLMRAHASLGERSTALRLYHRCVAVLEQELGMSPLPETIALFHAIRDAAVPAVG
ncbi:MAG: HEAT repeat domain-containing protein [Roseiflexaceae bacterium]|nr:HEAT repeat domain-containing protein [Roseiflexaceae bacterium]